MRKTPKILLILHHVYSKGDIYGNVYWITYAQSTVSGNGIAFSTPSDSNSSSIAKEATGGEWGRFSNTIEQVSIREYNRQRKVLSLHNSCHDENIVVALRKLANGK